MATATPSNDEKSPQTYLYFGYGSNMNPKLLAMKGMNILSSTCGTIPDYQLVFNLQSPSLVEPSYANLKEAKGATVHGVIHEFSEKDMIRMDALEGMVYIYIYCVCIT